MHRKPGTLHLILRTFPMYSQTKFLVPYICVNVLKFYSSGFCFTLYFSARGSWYLKKSDLGCGHSQTGDCVGPGCSNGKKFTSPLPCLCQVKSRVDHILTEWTILLMKKHIYFASIHHEQSWCSCSWWLLHCHKRWYFVYEHICTVWFSLRHSECCGGRDCGWWVVGCLQLQTENCLQ